jgi:hypothetical protein
MNSSLKRLHQILGIARMEIKFGLRRGFPVLGMILVSGLSSIVVYYSIYSGANSVYGDVTQVSSLGRGWTAFVALAPIVLPLVTILSIPSDRDFKVFSWLFSQPIDGAIYVLGKVLGMLAVVLGSWAAMTILHMIIYWIWIGSFAPGNDLLLMLVGGLPLVVWSTCLGVLAGGWLRSRREAIVTGVLLGLANMLWLNLLLPSLIEKVVPVPPLPAGTIIFGSGFLLNSVTNYPLLLIGMLPEFYPQPSALEFALVYGVTYLILILAAFMTVLRFSVRDTE